MNEQDEGGPQTVETQDSVNEPASPIAPLLPRHIHRGWWIVLAGAGILALTEITESNARSLLFVSEPSDELFGIIPRYLFVSLVAFSVLLVARPLGGYLIDRIGWHMVVTVVLIAGGMAFVLLSSVTNSMPSYTTAVVLGGFLSAGLYIALAVWATNFFSRNRGKALALILIGPTVPVLFQASLVDILLDVSMLASESSDRIYSWPVWRPTIVLPAIILCLAAIPFAYLWRQEGKESVPRGPTVAGEIEPELYVASDGPHSSRLRMTLRTKTYWVYALVFSLQSIGVSVMVLAAADTPFVITIPLLWYVDTTSIIALFGIVGLFISGALSDALDRRRVVIGILAIQLVCALGMVIASDTFEVFLFSIAASTGFGAMSAANASFLGEYLGGRHFGLLFGLQISAIALLTTGWWILAPQVGVSMSTDARPFQLLVASIVPLSIALLLVLLMKKPESRNTSVASETQVVA